MSTSSSTNAPAASFLSYQATTASATAQSAALAGLLALELILDDSKTLGSSIETMGNAGLSEAHSEKKSIDMQAASSALQGAGQMAGGLAVGISSGVGYAQTRGLSSQLEQEQGNLKNLNDLDKQMTQRNFQNPNEIELQNVNELGEETGPVADRKDGLTKGLWTDTNLSPEENKSLNTEAINHLTPNTDDFNDTQKELNRDIDNSNKMVSALSSQINTTQSFANSVGTVVKDVGGSIASLASAGTQMEQAKASEAKTEASMTTQLSNQTMSGLTKMIDSADQSLNTASQMTLQAAQLGASAV